MTARQPWAVVATAPDQVTAEMLRALLVTEGVSARIEPADVASYLGVRALPCRVLVPRDQLAGAQALLAEAAGSGFTVPPGQGVGKGEG